MSRTNVKDSRKCHDALQVEDYCLVEKPATALPTIEEQLECFVDIPIDIYLQDEQKQCMT